MVYCSAKLCMHYARLWFACTVHTMEPPMPCIYIFIMWQLQFLVLSYLLHAKNTDEQPRGDTKNKAKKYCLVKIKDTFTLSKKLYCKKKQCLEHTSYVLKVWYHSKAKKPDVHIRCSSYTTVLFFLKTFHWEGIHSRLLSLHEYVAEYLYVHCLTSNWCMI